MLARVVLKVLCIFLVVLSAPTQVMAMLKQPKHALSQQQIDFYFANGYLIVPNFFSASELRTVASCAARLQAEADQLALQQNGKIMYRGTQFVLDRINERTQIHRIVWAGAAEPELLALGRQQKLLVPVGQLLGSATADHLINQLHYKLPNDGVKFDWHQDIKNRRTFDAQWQDLNQKGSFVQTIIAIDPMTAENGAIFYVPKSHFAGDLFLDKITDRDELKRVAKLEQAVPLLLNPGDVIFMHPYLVHGSEPNESKESRRIFINGFSYPGANKQPYPGEGSAQQIVLN